MLGLLLLNQWVDIGQRNCVFDPAGMPPPIGPEGRPANYLHTCGSRLYDSLGSEGKITGLNWSGMEDGNYTPGGLGVRKWPEVLDQVAGLGYNTLRLPFSNQAIEPGRRIGGANFALNPDLQGLSGLEMLDRLVAGARDRGLKVILDRHRPTPGSWGPLWYDDEVSDERWIADWRMLAARYYGNDTVIGVDLHNEPRGPATWGSGGRDVDWRLAAERASDAILEVNPYLLIFVEGVESFDGHRYWWGGNLMGVRTAPVRLRVPNRVVYSPHDYGPNISAQPWFYESDFPLNLPGVWDRHWGYIKKENIAPVVLGEFGGRSVGSDREGQWQRSLIAYLKERDIGALVWSLNPGWDTGGVLAADWQTVERDKQEAYRQFLAAPLDDGALGVFGRAPTRFRVLFRQSQGQESDRISFTFRIVNDGPEMVDLSRVELRYWFRGGDAIGLVQQGPLDFSHSGVVHILIDFVPVSVGNQDYFIRVRFPASSGKLERYQVSDEITVQTPEIDPPNSVRTDDYSFAAGTDLRDRFGEWDHVTLYFDGQLVWGREP
ncbi:MAG: glycoside hydrolase family 5 protein [Chloroflexi bacterium]|nr:glycoside hydrolase family 5 protein [Chloroflexota bacterium]